jgi:GntR family transcriptional regulator, transcriptional repressor for pyruvate dehydrogenase complex
MATPEPQVTLTPAPRRRLTETVAEQLVNAIQALPPGTKVPSERELTMQLGVGRSTVREALNGLAMLGMVEIRHGQGAFVAATPVDTSEPSALTAALERGVTHDFIEARLIIEIEVARLAAVRRTDEDLANLEAVLVEQEERQGGDLALLLETAAGFNVQLAEAAHNEMLAAIIQSFVSLMIERGPRIYSVEDMADWDLNEHRQIVAAVRDRDPERAGQLMRGHIEALAERYRSVGAA